jgi:uncharacterized protein (TIGR02421 family)
VITSGVAGLLVSRGRLLINRSSWFPVRRVAALLQHEVGTHLLTYFNGRAQPFKQLYCGLAGYEELQEGLAVVAEYLAGGLTPARMRLIAGRVLAARFLIDGASFVETFRLLHHTYQFSLSTAYRMTMRTYRGGGLTKDVIYLRGLRTILAYLAGGGAIEPLLVGKIGAAHIPILPELEGRGILRPVPMRPRYLACPVAAARLQRLRGGVSILDLAKGTEP